MRSTADTVRSNPPLGVMAALIFCTSCQSTPVAPLEVPIASSGPTFVVLGAAQDAGRPQLGCTKECCADAIQNGHRDPVASLAVRGEEGWLLVDATPDVTSQIHAMGSMPSAVLLTHAHMGHYLGLAEFGRESKSTKELPVYCGGRFAKYLKNNGPWSQLVEQKEIEITSIGDYPFNPIPGVGVVGLQVPHRDEFSNTFGFAITAGDLRVVYLPDFDSWEEWGIEPWWVFKDFDVLLIDATFFDDHELPGRDMSQIPHPRVVQSMDVLQRLVDESSVRVVFTHLNHTNPLWDPHSAASQEVERRGFEVAYEGMSFSSAKRR